MIPNVGDSNKAGGPQFTALGSNWALSSNPSSIKTKQNKILPKDKSLEC
jgi:hypothetical protein